MSYAGPVKPVSGPRRILRLPVSPTDTDHATTLLTGVVFGMALGAGIALLLAPASGRDTRRKIVRSGRRLRRRGSDAWSDLGEELRRELRRVRRMARRRAEQRHLAEVSAAP